MELRETINYLRRTAGMPIRIVEDGAIMEYYGHAVFEPDPVADVTLHLWNSAKPACYTATPEYMFYGMVRQQNEDPGKALLFGPATPFTCTKEQAHDILIRIGGQPSRIYPFMQWLSGILPCDEQRFTDLLILAYRLLNETTCDPPAQIEFEVGSQGTYEMPEPRVTVLHEIDALASTGQESALLLNVERGDPEEVKRIFSVLRDQHARVPQVLADSLRNFKNIFIANVAFACVYATRGGLPSRDAMAVSDVYIRQVESLQSYTQIVRLFEQMYLDYAKRVAANGIPAADSLLVHKIYKDVREHLYEKITPGMIGKRLGVSVPHLCRIFKEETGKTITQYVNEKKIGEARQLLEQTSLSVIQISLQLDFSSQNYFQYIFKKITGMTPTAYRKNLLQ